MEMIENFAALSIEEQKAFAEALIKTINSEHTFSSDTDFKFAEVQASDHTGDLSVFVDTVDLVDVPREAYWNVYDEDELYSTPDESDVEYVDFKENDAKKIFKTLSAEIEGYNVELIIDIVEQEDIVDVEVDHVSHEDGGIGDYEYWGTRDYDSQPYLAVEGTIIKACSISVELLVTPVAQEVKPEAEEEI